MRFDRLYDVGAQDGPEVVSDRIVTVPNALSLARLLLLPFVWLDIQNGHPVRALVLLAVLASTDWVDGYVARRFNQVSKLGKLLDPISDRVLIIVVAIALGTAGIVPWWLLGAVLLRDVLVAGVGLVVLLRGGETPATTRMGKTATFAIMAAFPTLLGAEALEGVARNGIRSAALVVLVVGTVLYYGAAAQYARTLRPRSDSSAG